MDLRKAFFKKMEDLAEKDDKVILLTGDLGYSFFDDYKKKFPKQFLNVGIMEQGMIGIAAGMALGGLKPYVYSGAIFILMRPYEQIRDDICFNNLNVKLIGTGASGFLGFTHNLTGSENEMDLLKNLPNIRDYYPETEDNLNSIMNEAYESMRPYYIRL